MCTGENTPSESSLVWECTNALQQERNELIMELAAQTPPHQNNPNSLPDQQRVQAFLSRNEQQIRERYFQRLQRAGMLPEQPRKKLHHLIVFDWDDTLFCTSFLSILLQGQWMRAGQWEIQRVKEVDEAVARTLATALELASVCIVTNSVQGWVDHCVQTFMPLTLQLLLEAKIPVISARDSFEDKFPNNPQRWKTEAFASLLADLDKQILVNLVSVGDSTYEMDAADQASRRFERRFVKTIRLREKPRCEQLTKQLKLIHSKLVEVFTAPKNMSIKLQPKS